MTIEFMRAATSGSTPPALPRATAHSTRTSSLSLWWSSKPENTFGLGEKAMDKAYTLKTIEETHEFWAKFTASGKTEV